MEFWLMVLIQAFSTTLAVLAVLAGFWFKVVKPYLESKSKELVAAIREIEPEVTRGVKQGVADSLRDLPESTVKESTRQFLRFGSGLFENGLSSFLGSAEDLDQKSRASTRQSGTPGDYR